jgi:hypothetical protein
MQTYRSIADDIRSKFQELLDKVTLKRDQLLSHLKEAKNTAGMSLYPNFDWDSEYKK